MATKSPSDESSPRSSPLPESAKPDSNQDGKFNVEAALAEMERITFQDDTEDDFAEQREDQRLADAELESQRSEKRRNEAPQTAAPYDRREFIKQANAELNDSPAKASESTTPHGTARSVTSAKGVRSDRSSVEASPQAEGQRKVGFSDQADYFGEEDSSRSKGDEALVVARGNKFSMHREGDMLADDDWDRNMESDYQQREDSDNGETAVPTSSGPEQTQQNERQTKSASVSRDQRTELRRRRVQSAQLRATRDLPDSIDTEGEPRRRRNPLRNSPRSAYALSDEQKRSREKWHEQEKQRKLQQTERELEEKRQREEEKQQVFNSWLAEKKRQREQEEENERERQEIQRRREERRQKQHKLRESEEEEQRKKEFEEKRERRLRQEEERRQQEQSDAFKTWWDSKRKQLERDRKIEEERRKELNELMGIRSESEERRHKRECKRAFREWIKHKTEQEKRERERQEERARITRIVLKHIAQSQKISSAMQNTSSTRFTDYYGYRY